jgi:glycosyltransferase involved in cell wall biosynthesis
MSIANILYVHHDGLLTGSTLSLRNLLLGLDRSRFSPRVLLAQEGVARKLYEDMGIPVDMIPIRRMWTFPGPRFPKPDYFRNWLALVPNQELMDYLRLQQPALVHVNDKTLLPAGMMANQLGLPVVWHLRSTYAIANSRLQVVFSRNAIRRYASNLIAISEDEIDGFEDFSNLSVIYNSVDFSQITEAKKQRDKIRIELDLKADEILIGTVSTALNENRGSWDFIKAAGKLQVHFPDKKIRFVIVARIATPKVEIDAWKRADQAGIRKQLTLLGFRSDALSVMAAMDMVVICTRRAVLGRMPFEAMALGRPMVVTAGHSGRSQVVVAEETALVVPPEKPEAIAEGLARLLESTELCERLSKQGQAYAQQHFDSHKNALAVMKIYEEMLAKNYQS